MLNVHIKRLISFSVCIFNKNKCEFKQITFTTLLIYIYHLGNAWTIWAANKWSWYDIQRGFSISVLWQTLIKVSVSRYFFYIFFLMDPEGNVRLVLVSSFGWRLFAGTILIGFYIISYLQSGKLYASLHYIFQRITFIILRIHFF